MLNAPVADEELRVRFQHYLVGAQRVGTVGFQNLAQPLTSRFRAVGSHPSILT